MTESETVAVSGSTPVPDEAPWDIESIIAEATPQQRSTRICVRGDLREAYREAERTLKEASAGHEDGEPTPQMVALAAKLADAQAQIENHMRRITFRSIGPNWQTIRKKYENEQEDIVDDLGYAAELFSAAAVRPEMTTEQARRLVERLSQGDINELFKTATLANFEATVEVPKSPLASRILEGGNSSSS